MAENKTPIVIPEQADGLEGLVAGAVQATGQAADQHVEPAVPAQPAAAAPAETGNPVPTPGTPGPLGDVISTQ